MARGIRTVDTARNEGADELGRGHPGSATQAGRMLAAMALCSAMLLASGSVQADPAGGETEGEVLYNGIRLSSPWPPRRTGLSLDPPPPPPYLVNPPAVIPIDVGRQLFVDDFLIEETTTTRAFHQAEYYEGNPVLSPDKPWEQKPHEKSAGCAMPFSDGVWYDPADSLFKMWHMGGYVQATCYATSADGIHWEKPSLDVQPGTNVVLSTGRRDSCLVWLDLEETDASRRYKMYLNDDPQGIRGSLHLSRDGIHWGDAVTKVTPCTSDRNSFFRNPFRGIWVYSIKDRVSNLGRNRRYRECVDLVAGAKWHEEELVPWVGADRLEPQREDLRTQPEIYNLDAVAYESVMLGLFTIWRGQPSDRPKPNEVVLGYSRDGFNWRRPERKAFIPVSERPGDWNWGNVQSTGGGCLVVGDKLYFYVSGRAGVPGTSASGVCSTGLAILRRDGFASMRAEEAEQTLTTRPVRFSGKHMFVNSDADEGELRIEVLDENGQVIAPFNRDNCIPIQSDRTQQAVAWKGADDLSELAGKPVRFRFHLRRGRLYSFWVTPDKSGASHGYVAAGGPGFTGPTDTVGRVAAGGNGRQ